MPDALIPISGRSVTLKYRDMGDGSFARVVSLNDLSVDGNKTYRVSGRALTIRYTKDFADETHAETYHRGASAQAQDKLVEISGRALTLRYRRLSDGTYAECVWVGKSSQATDKIYPVSGRDISIRYRDMADGTFAMVVWEGSSAQATDRLYSISGRGLAIKYRDMGDGTFAEVVYDQLSPASLFTAGEQGAWYDPSDYGPTGTLFQDAAGTTPTTMETRVRLMLDKSGRGNHATAPSDASSPILRARYNLLLNTIFAGAVAGSPGTAPSSWIFAFSTGTLSIPSAGQLTCTASGTRQVLGQTFTAAANTTYSCTALIVQNSGLTANQITEVTSAPAGSTISFFLDGVSILSSVVPTANSRLEIRLAVAATSGTPTWRLGAGANNVATGSVTFSEPDIRTSSDAALNIPAYQSITTATSYDTNGFPPYLAFDGTDDSFSTASINFSGTDEMTVFAGVGKLSDAGAAAIIAELSTGSTNNRYTLGGFLAGTPAYYFYGSGGTALVGVEASSSVYAAPVTNVLTASSKIGAPVVTLRVNGAQIATNTSSQGTGNYPNAPIFIGRRNNSIFPLNGRIYSLIIRGAATTTPLIASTEQWVAGKMRLPI